MKQNSKVKRLQADRERAKNIRETLRRQRDEEMAAISEIRLVVLVVERLDSGMVVVWIVLEDHHIDVTVLL